MVNQRIRNFGVGVNRELLYNEKLVIYTIDSMQDEVADAWHEACLDTLGWHPRERSLRIVHHLLNHDGIFTPYARQKLHDVVKASEDWQGYTAIVIQRSITSQIIKLTMERLSKIWRRWNIRFFYERKEAIEWLMAQPDK